ncbi:MAG: IPT/TIG domain-containing protein, partial [Isosphaeraceae bacterium]
PTPTVDFGPTAATNVTVVSATSITADSPAGTNGNVVDVTVKTATGTSATTPADQFTYGTAATPTVTAITPATGPAAGVTLVTITGTNFTGSPTPTVDFGPTAALW